MEMQCWSIKSDFKTLATVPLSTHTALLPLGKDHLWILANIGLIGQFALGYYRLHVQRQGHELSMHHRAWYLSTFGYIVLGMASNISRLRAWQWGTHGCLTNGSGFNHLAGLDVIKHLQKIQSVNIPTRKQEKYFAYL
jgi:hypothetical protein